MKTDQTQLKAVNQRPAPQRTCSTGNHRARAQLTAPATASTGAVCTVHLGWTCFVTAISDKVAGVT